MRNTSNNKALKFNLPCRQCAHAAICLDFSKEEHEHLEESSFHLQSKAIKSGQHVCYQGHPSSHLYILRSGLLKSYVIKANGQEFVMGFILPSDLFGWEGFDKPRHAISVIALIDSQVCVIDSKKIFTAALHSPQLSQKLLRIISRRIHQDNIALLRTSAIQRVSTFLLQLAARYRELGYSGDRCQLHMSFQDIANYLRINPCTISRVLHELEKSHLIEMHKNTVMLKDIPQLRMFAEMEPPHSQ